MHKLIQRHYIIIIIAIIAVTASLANASQDKLMLRVGLTRYGKNVKQITVIASSPYAIYKLGTLIKLASFTNLEYITLAAADGEIELKRDNGLTAKTGTAISIVPNDPNSLISVDSPGKPFQQFRGKLEVTNNNGNLQMVNVVQLDDYLKGVLPGEMPSSFPIEALKAQAVASRTYVLTRLNKHKADNFDVCDSTCCQMYVGASREHCKCTKAVLETKGQVLTYKKKLASTMYHSNCGGVTHSYADDYATYDFPYLNGNIKDVCKPINWEIIVKPEELSEKLVKAGIADACGLTGIRATKIGTSGRILCVELASPTGITYISGCKLREIIGYGVMKSTLCSIESLQDGTIKISGKGWGHGIGMCQWGAKALAEPPYNYTYNKILAYYYPGTQIMSMANAELTTYPELKPVNPNPACFEKEGCRILAPEDTKKPAKMKNSSGTFPIKIRIKAPSHL